MSDDVAPKKRGLGRGLSALLGEVVAVAVEAPPVGANALAVIESGRAPKTLPVEKLRPGKYQPRRAFDEDRINDLVESIREKGIIQPLLVRRLDGPGEIYEIVAGERRWRAAQLARLHEVPVIVRELDDREALEIALVENLQRQDLTPLEEADGYRRLMDEFKHTQEDLARTVGKSRSHVANMMRLLALPDPLKHMVEKNELSAGHARALLTAADPVGLAQQVIAKGLNVRQTERLAQAASADRKPSSGSPSPRDDKDPDTLALERDLSNALGLKVSIRQLGKGGELAIQYGTLEQLDDILHRLSHGGHGDDDEAV